MIARLQPGGAAEPSDRLARLEQLIDRCIHDVTEGRRIDSDALLRDHPDLLPDLQERLEQIQCLAEAAQVARRNEDHRAAATHNLAATQMRILRESLDDYEILAPLKHGGQGMVYEAQQKSPRRRVALKVLRHGAFASERQRARFLREIDILSRFRHPNIVTVYDGGLAGSLAYFAMEYVDGTPIDDFAILGDLSTADRMRLFIPVCQAVHAVHQFGVIHRDLKPSNILVDEGGVPHVLDFGLAKALDEEGDEGLTSEGFIIGTLNYLSPEQAGGRLDQTDVRSDVYTLGVILFELLTGRLPYPEGLSPQALRACISGGEPLHLRSACKDPAGLTEAVPRALVDDLDAVLAKALEPEKARRYASPAHLAEDLERLLRGDAVSAKADRRFYVLRKTFRRHRIALSVATAFLIVIGVFTGMLVRQIFEKRVLSASAVERQWELGRVYNRILPDVRRMRQALNRAQETRNMPPDLAEAWLARFQRPAVDLDCEFETVCSDAPERIFLAPPEAPTDPRHQQALDWFLSRRSTLLTIAEAARRAPVQLKVDNELGYANAFEFNTVGRASICGKGLASLALRAVRDGDECQALELLETARCMAIDLGDEATTIPLSSAISLRSRCYDVIEAALMEGFDTGSPWMGLTVWVLDDPPMPQLDPVLIHLRMELHQYLSRAYVVDPDSGEPMLSVRAYNAPLRGSSIEETTEETVAQDLFPAQEVVDAAERALQLLDGSETMPLWGYWAQLQERQTLLRKSYERYPFLQRSTPDILFVLRQRAIARQRALQLVARAILLHEREGRWPQAVDQILEPRELESFMDPITKQRFEFTVYAGVPVVRSVRIAERESEYLQTLPQWLADESCMQYFPTPAE